MSIGRPRGTRDFAPDEMAQRNEAAARLRRVFDRFGYREVATPTFEQLELFTAKSGEGIISELYNFEDKGGRQVTLRPELTAPVMRMVYQDHAFDPKPLKWFYYANCFRYDRPQTGRYREFWQFGCEQVGAGTPLAYAELIALADGCFEELGLAGRDLAVGHVGLLKQAIDDLELQPEIHSNLMRVIDKEGWGESTALSLERHGCPTGAIRHAERLLSAKSLEELRGGLEQDARFQELEATFEHLQALGVDARLNLGIARGLDYYTGIVFEVHSPALGAQSQLLGGGGYDLSGVFGAQSMPTMGFGLGFDRTLVALEAEGAQLPAPVGPVAYFGALGEAAQARVLGLVKELRGDRIPVDMDLVGRKPGQIAKHADAVGAHYLVILGDRDLENGAARVKDLRSEGGEQHDVPLDDLLHWLTVRSGHDDLKDYN